MRYAKLEGRDHIVVPMVMLKVGTHQGSNGPLYYPEEELRKTPQVWNHKPVVVYHPTLYGKPVSACDVPVLNTIKIGVILNTRYSRGKLMAEAWIDIAAAERVDRRVLSAIAANQKMEISTGVFTDNVLVNGVMTARNYRPDHLAILPDQVGACSLRKGCGLLVRNAAAAMTPLGLPVMNWGAN
jgi:hypothetical protein